MRITTTLAGLGVGFQIALAGLVASAADLYVPADFSVIQSAINAAAAGDVIHLASGHYNERLVINKSLTLLGSGTNDCVLYCFTNLPIIAITGPASCVLSNFEIEGGQYMWPDWYSGFSPLGIVSTNATLTLQSLVMNQINNYFVTVINGSLAATNVGLWTRNVLGACDIGFQLKGCTGSISQLSQPAGHLDHTININDPPASHSDVTISDCTLQASSGSYGNCIRTYTDSNVRISHCLLYRNPSNAVPPYPAFNHNGVSISGYSNSVLIADNTFTNLPWAIYCVGSLGGNKVVVENNAIMNCSIGGIVWDSMSYRGIDLGGGNLGSQGGNVFSELPAPLTNFTTDILFTNLNGASSANIFAQHNTWSNPTNRETVIYDRLDNPIFGRLITDDLTIKAIEQTAGAQTVLTWNERGAREKYTVQFTSDLTSGLWTNAPGAWPITNTSLQDLRWTNSTPNTGAAAFYRISSLVP